MVDRKSCIPAIICLLFLFITSNSAARTLTIKEPVENPNIKEPSFGPVRVENGRLKTDFDGNGIYELFYVNGIGYSPRPICTFPHGIESYYIGFLKQSFPLEACLCNEDKRPYPLEPCIYANYQFVSGDAVDVCSEPTLQFRSGDKSIYDSIQVDLDRDFQLLKEMNVNVIRTWGAVGAQESWDEEDCYGWPCEPPYYLGPYTTKLLDKAEEYGIKVIAGYWIDWNAIIDESHPYSYRTRLYIRQSYKKYIQAYKDHPAILAWAIGNENNYHHGHQALSGIYSLTNEMAQIAYEIEGTHYHPVILVNGEIEDIGIVANKSDDEQLSYVDIWGVNVYRGKNFGTFFEDYKAKTNKPLLITEYGIDAFNNNTQQEDQEAQAEWDLAIYREIRKHPDICFGSVLMNYSDEWWKGRAIWSENACYQDSAGRYMPEGTSQDNAFNEEYWGVMAIEKNNDEFTERYSPWTKMWHWTAPDKMKPRLVYYVMQEEFGKGVKCGDLNADGEVTIGDIQILIDDLFITYQKKLVGNPYADVNGDGQLTIGDASLLIDHLFISNSPLNCN